MAPHTRFLTLPLLGFRPRWPNPSRMVGAQPNSRLSPSLSAMTGLRRFEPSGERTYRPFADDSANYQIDPLLAFEGGPINGREAR
jgi:hypothetical protein